MRTAGLGQAAEVSARRDARGEPSATFQKVNRLPPRITGPDPREFPPARVGEPYTVRFLSDGGPDVVWGIHGGARQP